MNAHAAPSLECDLVMKGGITSGVIYPRAIATLAQRYRLRSIGGASAGAIAAVLAAAAEYRRAAGDEDRGVGFEALARLPTTLTEPVGAAGRSRLLSLFQPSPAARPAFRVLLAALEGASPAGKGLAMAGVVLGHAGSLAPLLAGLAAGVGLVVLVARTGSAGACALAVLGGLAVVAIGLLAAALVFVRDALRAFGPEGRYGMCPGYSKESDRSDTPAVTSWLARTINAIGGAEGGPPLTFGQLGKKGIVVQLMTTDLTHGRPYRLPFDPSERGKYFFSEAEFRALFPDEVVDVMVAGARALLDGSASAEDQGTGRLREIWSAITNRGDKLPFPDDDHLPLVVGARLSLSFPVLLQAVPLYAIDWTLKANEGASHKLEVCWFSDGGICSNLPIHFFDALIPGRPTFAIDLKDEHPDHKVRTPPFQPGESERNNVWIPTNSTGGISAAWDRFSDEPAKVPLLSFLGTVVDTMQCWNDNLTMHYPGYRDRVVHISHRADEGGLNLAMPNSVVDRLAARGAAAGEVLCQKFDPSTGDGWPNHLWVRYRALLAMLAEEAPGITAGLNGPLNGIFAGPTATYKLTSGQHANAQAVNTALLDLSAKLVATPPVEEGAPHPRAALKARPRSG